MKIDKKDSSDERRILIGMIVDQTVLARIGTKWKGRMFRSKWANLIASWCLKYHAKYNEAPLRRIESLYERWSGKTRDKNNVTLVGKFLDSLSEEYEQMQEESNSDYIIDLAGSYFNRIQMERLIDEAQEDIDVGDTDQAHQKLSAYNQIELGVGEGVNVLQDKDAIIEAFESKKEPLISYPGDLGVFFGDAMERDGFISFMGPEKRGKSFWLLDVAFRAFVKRKRVAFFEVGDMSQNQIMRRFMERISKQPFYASEIRIPKLIKVTEDGIRIKGRAKEFESNLDWRRAWKACKEMMKSKIKSQEPYLKLSCHPNSTLNVQGLESILLDWGRVGWTPDVIVIDYADILDLSAPGFEGRDCINETWKKLRALSQRYHCLVVTATQSDTASYSKKTITMSNFSEDKRKAAHITGMIGINQTTKEKKMGVMRLNWVARREARYNEKRCVLVAGCLDISNPAMESLFEKFSKKSEKD